MKRASRMVTIAAMAAWAAAVTAQMSMLRPMPVSISEADRAELQALRIQVRQQGQALCTAWAQYRSQCEGVESPACQSSYAQIDSSRVSFNTVADRYNEAVLAKLKGRERALDARVKRDQQAIRALGLHHDAAEFDNWTEWLTQQDQQRQEQGMEAVREAAKQAVFFKIDEAIRLGAYQAASLDPQKAPALIAKLRTAGADDPLFLDAVRAFANAKGKQEKAEKALEVLHGLKKAHALWELSDIGPDRESYTWKAGAALLEIFIPDPRLQLMGKLTLDEVRVVFYTAWEATLDFSVFSDHVDQLDKLTQDHLLILKHLSKQLQADVDEHVKAERELKNIDQQPPEPAC